MKLLISAVTVCLGLALSAAILHADAAPTTVPTTQPMAVNKICPVSNEAVDPKIPTIEYHGKIIGFCCADCVKDFKANPEKYVANLK